MPTTPDLTNNRYPIVGTDDLDDGLLISGEFDTPLHILLELAEEIKPFLSEGGYPVRLRAWQRNPSSGHIEKRTVTIDGRFAPFRDNCFSLFNAYKSFLLNQYPVDGRWLVWLSLSQNEGGLDFVDYCTEDEAFWAFWLRPFDGDHEDVPPVYWCGAPVTYELNEIEAHYNEGYGPLNQAKWCKKCTGYIPFGSTNDICNQCNPDGPALRNLLASPLEKTFYHALTRAFPQALICPKVGLKDVFDWETMKLKLTYEQRTYMWKAHIDYLVVDAQDHRPLRAIEADGYQHQVDQDTVDRDTLKDQICAVGGLPLTRVPNIYSTMTTDEMITALTEHLGNADQIL